MLAKTPKSWRNSRLAAEKALEESIYKAGKTRSRYDLVSRLSQIKGLEPLGEGMQGIVVRTPKQADGNRTAIKIGYDSANKNEVLNEINASALAGEVGIGPKLFRAIVKEDPNNTKKYISAIEMEYMPSSRFELLEDLQGRVYSKFGRKKLDEVSADIESYGDAQKAYILKHGYRLGDRHAQNVMIDNETGLPVQIDYGYSYPIKEDQNRILSAGGIVVERLRQNGQHDEAVILDGVLSDLTGKGDIQGALDVIDDAIYVTSTYLPSQVGEIQSILSPDAKPKKNIQSSWVEFMNS